MAEYRPIARVYTTTGSHQVCVIPELTVGSEITQEVARMIREGMTLYIREVVRFEGRRSIFGYRPTVFFPENVVRVEADQH